MQNIVHVQNNPTGKSKRTNELGLQESLAELFDTSRQNVGQQFVNIINDGELQENSVVKNYFTTASALNLSI